MNKTLLALALAIAPAVASAQTDAVTSIPPAIVVPNYNGVPVGPFGGLEASAYVARASDPSAAWFNPAGLSRSTGAEISGSAAVYQFTKVAPTSFPDAAGGGVQQVPNLVGFVMRSHNLTLGAAFLTTVSWDQETDSQNTDRAPSGSPRRFAYSADATLERRVGAFSAGYDSGKKWRAGAGLAFSFTSLRLTQTTSDRIADPADLRTLLVSSRMTGSTLQLRALFGGQYDPTPSIRIGGTLRVSGVALTRNGSATFDGTQSSGAASVGASFFDPSADFDYKLPLEAGGGIAFVRPRGEIEIDVTGYTAISPYAMISSPEDILVYLDAGNGAPPVVQAQPISGLTTASRALANISVGGHLQLFRDKEVRLHFGITSDLSPVADEDEIFDRVDFVAWTIGLSGSAGRFTYAAGVNYRGGTTDAVVIRNVLIDQPVLTTISIRTIGMIYSLSYQF